MNVSQTRFQPTRSYLHDSRDCLTAFQLDEPLSPKIQGWPMVPPSAPPNNKVKRSRERSLRIGPQHVNTRTQDCGIRDSGWPELLDEWFVSHVPASPIVSQVAMGVCEAAIRSGRQ